MILRGGGGAFEDFLNKYFDLEYVENTYFDLEDGEKKYFNPSDLLQSRIENTTKMKINNLIWPSFSFSSLPLSLLPLLYSPSSSLPISLLPHHLYILHSSQSATSLPLLFSEILSSTSLPLCLSSISILLINSSSLSLPSSPSSS